MYTSITGNSIML